MLEGSRRAFFAVLSVAAMVAASAVAVVPSFAGSGVHAALASPDTWTFVYTGDVQSFTVPAGVTQLGVIVVGAGGGSGVHFGSIPGSGGSVTGSLTVTPGEELAVWVGGRGGANSSNGIDPSPGGAGGWGSPAAATEVAPTASSRAAGAAVAAPARSPLLRRARRAVVGPGPRAARSWRSPVEPAPTTVALTATPEPSQKGEVVVFAADVTADVPGVSLTPDGVVRFRVDGVEVGDAVPLTDGHAVSAGHDKLTPGFHRIVAVYESLDGNFHRSRAEIRHEVREPSATMVASSANPVAAGQPITLAAHVGPKATGGSLSFSIDGTPVPECQNLPVSDSRANCDAVRLAAGTHQVAAAYSGGPALDPSTGTLVEVVNELVPKFTG